LIAERCHSYTFLWHTLPLDMNPVEHVLEIIGGNINHIAL